MLQAREDERKTHVLTRGDFLKPGKLVGPGVPAILQPMPEEAPLTVSCRSRRRLPRQDHRGGHEQGPRVFRCIWLRDFDPAAGDNLDDYLIIQSNYWGVLTLVSKPGDLWLANSAGEVVATTDASIAAWIDRELSGGAQPRHAA